MSEPKKKKKLNKFEEFMVNAKKDFKSSRTFPKIDISKLNEKQAKVYNMVKEHIENPTEVLRAVCNGPGGTGWL